MIANFCQIFLQVLVVPILLMNCSSSKGVDHTSMEKMLYRSGFLSHKASAAEEKHELVFAIKQNNLSALEGILMDISSPSSSKYQQWLTYDEVSTLISNENGFTRVLEWLQEQEGGEEVSDGSNDVCILWTSRRKEYIRASASIRTWERLLRTTFYEWRDYNSATASAVGGATTKKTTTTTGADSFSTYHRAHEYSVPVHVAEHIAAVFNTVQVPPVLRRTATITGEEDVVTHHVASSVLSADAAQKLLEKKRARKIQENLGMKGHSSHPYQHHHQHHLSSERSDSDSKIERSEAAVEGVFKTTLRVGHGSSSTGNSNSNSIRDSPDSTDASQVRAEASADGTVTVGFLNSLYQVYSGNIGSPSMSQSVFSTNDEYFSTNDLKKFQNKNNIPLQSAVAFDGYSTEDCDSDMSCTEGNLDMQYIMGMAQQLVSIYWHSPSTGGVDPFVAWITDVADETNPPQASSISWGSLENYLPKSTMNAWNTEALKLASMGVTIVASSGDSGVSWSLNEECLCGSDSGSSQSNWAGSGSWSGTGYFPSFPASSPYVTAVGATQGPEDGDPEIACQSQLGGVITSGGGFSSYFAQPSWQTAAVDSYFNSSSGDSDDNTPTSGYNPLGRGYPDISLIGVWYEVYIRNSPSYVFGTSASAPVFAAFVSLINSARHDEGLNTIGFINPTLYQVGSNKTFAESVNASYNDVTSGHNKCCASSTGYSSDAVCCEAGFHTSSGWDPVTGWGSVHYTELAGMFGVNVTYDQYSGGEHSRKSGGSGGGGGGVFDISLEWNRFWYGVVLVSALCLASAIAYYGTKYCQQTPLSYMRARRVTVGAPQLNGGLSGAQMSIVYPQRQHQYTHHHLNGGDELTELEMISLAESISADEFHRQQSMRSGTGTGTGGAASSSSSSSTAVVGPDGFERYEHLLVADEETENSGSTVPVQGRHNNGSNSISNSNNGSVDCCHNDNTAGIDENGHTRAPAGGDMAPSAPFVPVAVAEPIDN